MKHGIGPQSLGASGMNPKSTPCGHPKITPLDFNDALEQAAIDGKLNKPFEKKVLANMEKKTEGDSSTSPVEFNVFENADPRAAANMMSDMAPTGGGSTPSAIGPMGIAPGAGDLARRSGGSIDGGLAGGVVGLLKSKVGNGGFLNRKRKLSRRIATGEPMTPAGPTVNSPGGGAGGAVASAEAAQASADAANSQIDALKEKLSGIRNLLNQTAGMV